MMTKALLVPADEAKAPRILGLNSERPSQVSMLIFDGYRSGPVGMHTVRAHCLQFAFDDLGLLKPNPVYNRRIMAAYETYTGAVLNQPFAGDWLAMGVDPYSGETEDVPDDFVSLLGVKA